MTLSMEAQQRLKTEKNIWLATVRPDGRPHLTPVWFTWHAEKLYVCIQPESVKARNMAQNPYVALSLEDGSSVVIGEGIAAAVPRPWPEGVRAAFQQKYDWDIVKSQDYTLLVEVTPAKWLTW